MASTVWDAGHLANLATAVNHQRVDSQLLDSVPAAVRQAGGAARLAACGSIQTNPSEAPLAAWSLGLQMLATESSDGNVLIQSRSDASAKLLPSVSRGHRLVAHRGAVKIFEQCARVRS